MSKKKQCRREEGKREREKVTRMKKKGKELKIHKERDKYEIRC